MSSDPTLAFGPAVQTWFRANFDAPTAIQRRGWPVISAGRHALLVAPTGSGKTLAAFLAAIDGLSTLPDDAPPGVRVVYVSPLRALVYDVERNLRAPLAGVLRAAEGQGLRLRPVGVDVRTGDTPAAERRRQARAPSDILVTTPESLFLILGSRAREGLRTVRTVIVDEIHALAGSKRGTHLALSLERLAEVAGADPQRIGLSATVRPLDEVARFLGGDRPVEVVDASAPPALDLRIEVPEPAELPQPPHRPGGPVLREPYAVPADRTRRERGRWAAIYPRLIDEIRAHRSTLVFVNSRGLCERLTHKLNELAGEELVRAHHGSLSHRRRAEIEEDLKAGRVRGIVATSSLELGIDMGAVDLVLLVESPGSVARGLQRVGRAGHRVGEVSVARIYPKFRGDLLECAVIARGMVRGEIEPVRIPVNPLDVLAQQVVAVCADRARGVDEILALARRSHPYRTLTRPALEAVLDMLSGRYPSDEFAELRPLLRWDRSGDRVSARRGAALVTRLNPGTIPDRGAFPVVLCGGGPRLGELDEEMVHETRRGDTILLGASTWRVEEITRDRVVVSPAPGEPGRLPFWRGEGPGRPVELGRALGAFVREVGAMGPDEAVEWLTARTPLDRGAARDLVGYLAGQREHTGTLPTDRSITVERFRDELGDWRVCILSPFGARVHAPWAMAIQHTLSGRAGFEVQVMYTDDGIVVRFADVEAPPGADVLFPDPDEVEDRVVEQAADSALFAGLFRENAVRSLLLARRSPEGRRPLWAQRLKAQALLAAARRYPGFPVVLETYRQLFADVFDMPGLTALLRAVRSREIRVREVETPSASPFARSLVFAYVAAFMYEQDAPLPERKAQALTLDRALLAELLGREELRELIDPEALAEVEAELQRLVPDRRARGPDEAHDLLRRVGDLTLEELRERCAGDPEPWLPGLARQGRAARIRVAGEERWIAAEDAGLMRDALGAVPPPGLPGVFLAPVPDALERLVRRYARTHGPFLTRDPAARYGLSEAQVEPVLRLLEARGALVRGELRPGGSEPEWCDTEVLRRIKRRTLARLRRQVAPVEGAALGRFLPGWHGIGGGRAGEEGLLEAVGQLEGHPVSWAVLSRVLLPQRVGDFRPEMLDLLAAAGRIVWVGRGPLGPRDGRVALYPRERAPELIEVPPYDPPAEAHAAVLRVLAQRGALFLVELEGAVREACPGLTAAEFRDVVWDLVWAGQVTNDTFAPLRSLGRRPARTVRGRRRQGVGLAGGRWSLVAALAGSAPEPTRRAAALARMLLERYGVVSRDAARAEEIPGGFGAVYPVLRAMEERGKVQRGYFVEGLPGAQFAEAGALDRLRAVGEARPPEDPVTDGEVLVLAALDPANPYGALLPWPDRPAGQGPALRRVPDAWVVLVDGFCLLYVGPRGRHVGTFGSPAAERPGALEAAVRALHRLPRPRRGFRIEHIDGAPAAESALLPVFLEAGFERDYRGLCPRPGGARKP